MTDANIIRQKYEQNINENLGNVKLLDIRVMSALVARGKPGVNPVYNVSSIR
jgi:hypothetical protein